MVLQDSVQRSLQNPAEKNPADPHNFAKVKNLGMQNVLWKLQFLLQKHHLRTTQNKQNLVLQYALSGKQLQIRARDLPASRWLQNVKETETFNFCQFFVKFLEIHW